MADDVADDVACTPSCHHTVVYAHAMWHTHSIIKGEIIAKSPYWANTDFLNPSILTYMSHHLDFSNVGLCVLYFIAGDMADNTNLQGHC